MHDHLVKFERGKKHVADLYESLRDPAFISVFKLTPHFDGSRGMFDVYAHFTEPPSLWSQLAGDALHNLRSSLDALVYALVRHHVGDLSESHERNLQFPICSTSKQFADEARRRLAGMWQPAADAIERLQPYNTKNWVNGPPLAALQTLSNIDKHRRLLFLHKSIASGHLSLTRHGGKEPLLTVPLRPGVLRSGDVVAAYELPPDVHAETVHVGSAVGLNMIFDVASLTYPNIEACLDCIMHFIKLDVFRALEPYLPADHAPSSPTRE